MSSPITPGLDLTKACWVRWRMYTRQRDAEIFASGPALVARVNWQSMRLGQSLMHGVLRGFVAEPDLEIVNAGTNASLFTTERRADGIIEVHGNDGLIGTVEGTGSQDAAVLRSAAGPTGRYLPEKENWKTRSRERAWPADIVAIDGTAVAEVRSEGVSSALIPSDGLIGPLDFAFLPSLAPNPVLAVLGFCAALLDTQLREGRQKGEGVSAKPDWKAAPGLSLRESRKAEQARTAESHRDKFLREHPDFAQEHPDYVRKHPDFAPRPDDEDT